MSNSLYYWQNEYWFCSHRSGDALNGNLLKKKKYTPCQPTLMLVCRQSPELGSHQWLKFRNKIMIAWSYLSGTKDFPHYLNFKHFIELLPKHTWYRKEN